MIMVLLLGVEGTNNVTELYQWGFSRFLHLEHFDVPTFRTLCDDTGFTNVTLYGNDLAVSGPSWESRDTVLN